MTDPDSAVPTSISPSPPPQLDSASAKAEPDNRTFRLLELPVEIVLLVISHLDERPYSASFPAGPPTDLLRLSEASRFFCSACRPRIWSAISYVLIPPKKAVTPEYRHSRSLSALNEIVRLCQGQGQGGAKQADLFPAVPLVRLSVKGADKNRNWMLIRALQASQPQTDDQALVELVGMLGKSTAHTAER